MPNGTCLTQILQRWHLEVETDILTLVFGVLDTKVENQT